MAAGAYDLTTLAAVKAWLGIPDATTTSDALLQSLLTSASRFLLNYLSRGNILSQSYTDRFSGSGWGQTSLLLPRWPVTSISALSISGSAIPAGVAAAANVPETSGYLLEPWDGVPAGKMQSIDLLGYGFGCGAQNITVSYVAGYLVAGEAATVPGVSTYTVTAAQPYGAWAADGGVVLVSSGAALTKVATAPAAGQYSVAAGVYTFNVAQANAAVRLSYSFIPYDLAQACSQMVGEQYTYRSRIGIASKSLGGQETITFSQRNLTPDLRDMLQNYKNVVPFV